MEKARGPIIIGAVCAISAVSIFFTYRYVHSGEIKYQANSVLATNISLVGQDLSNGSASSTEFADWQKLIGETNGTSTTPAATGTITDQYSKDLFSKYMALKEQKGILSADDENNLIQDLAEDATNLATSSARVYTEKTSVIVKPTPANIKAYGENLNEVLASHTWIPMTMNLSCFKVFWMTIILRQLQT